LPTSLNLLFVILSIDYDRNGHSKGSPFFIEKFQILAPNWHQKKVTIFEVVTSWFLVGQLVPKKHPQLVLVCLIWFKL